MRQDPPRCCAARTRNQTSSVRHVAGGYVGTEATVHTGRYVVGGDGFWMSPVFERSCIVCLAAKFWRGGRVDLSEWGMERHTVLNMILRHT